MDPSSVIAADRLGRQLHGVVFGDSAGPKKFGLGNEAAEREKCADFLLYATVGGLRTRKKVVLVPGAGVGGPGAVALAEARDRALESVSTTSGPTSPSAERGAAEKTTRAGDTAGSPAAPVGAAAQLPGPTTSTPKVILDRDGYELDPAWALARFSDRCRVSLQFVDSQTRVEALARATVEGTGGTLRWLRRRGEA